MSEMDWNVELRKIEREFDGLPPEPSPVEVRARRAAERQAQQRKHDRVAAVGAWARLLLVAALAGALNLWPYLRECGPGLFAYIAAEAVIIIGGLWVAACTWRCRMAMTHSVALMMALWGLALIEMQVLPRVGYAKVDPRNPPQWWCAGAVPTWPSWMVR